MNDPAFQKVVTSWTASEAYQKLRDATSKSPLTREMIGCHRQRPMVRRRSIACINVAISGTTRDWQSWLDCPSLAQCPKPLRDIGPGALRLSGAFC